MDNREGMRLCIRVRVAELSKNKKNIADLKEAVLKENFTPRRKGAIGTIWKEKLGIKGDVVIVKHEDDDGLGRFNGEVAAYYAFELEELF